MNMWLQIIANDVSQLLPVTDVERKEKEKKGSQTVVRQPESKRRGEVGEVK